MTSRPFFTIVTPTYNRPDRLKRAIISVNNQTFRDFEMIIINDGSTLDYLEVEKFIKQSNIKYFYRNNNGRSAARNYGFEQAVGQYICLLDDDDVFIENHLEILHKAIQQQKYEIALFRTLAFGVQEKEIDSVEIPPKEFSIEKKNNLFEREKNKYVNLFGTGAVAIHRKILEKHKFNTEIIFWEDVDLWLRITSLYSFYKINQFTVKYVLHDDNTIAWSEKNLKEKFKTLLYFKKQYNKKLPSDFLNNNISDTSLGIADFLSREKKLITLKYLKIAAIYKPSNLFSRQFIGIFKNLIFKR